MSRHPRTIRLTTAQVLARHLANQFIEIDDVRQHVRGGGFGIFGHGNVICLKADAFEGWTKEGHTWWEIGTPSVSNLPEVLQAHDDVERGRERQRAGV